MTRAKDGGGSAKGATGKNLNPAKGDPVKPASNDALYVAGQPGETAEAGMARIACDPVARAVGVGRRFVAPIIGERPLTDIYKTLERRVAEVERGDLSSLERTLVAQADTLDAIFADMARRAALNAGQYLDSMDTYMRLALKAQAQCRATVEALAAIKNPAPVLIAKQANIATGPQQVNNGAAPAARTLGEKHDIEHQSHAPEAARPVSTSGRTPLLSHQPTERAPMRGAGSER